MLLSIRRRKQIINSIFGAPGAAALTSSPFWPSSTLGEQRGAERFPSGWFTGWCLEGRVTDRHTEKRERANQATGRKRKRWETGFRNVQECLVEREWREGCRLCQLTIKSLQWTVYPFWLLASPSDLCGILSSKFIKPEATFQTFRIQLLSTARALDQYSFLHHL